MPAFHHAGLTVRNLERALEFYRDLLGMDVVMQQEKAGGYLAAIVGYPDAHVKMAHLAFPDGGARIELFEYVRPEPRGAAGEPRDVGITHVCLVVEDIDSITERLRTAGVGFYSPPIAVDTGANAGGWGVYVRDRDGITVELFQPRREDA